jgi:hypothetical protein
MRYVFTILRVCRDSLSTWLPRAVIIHVNRLRMTSFVITPFRLSIATPLLVGW